MINIFFITKRFYYITHILIVTTHTVYNNIKQMFATDFTD
jgi:hypothetical protein